MASKSGERDAKHLFHAVISCLNYIATNPSRGAMTRNNSPLPRPQQNCRTPFSSASSLSLSPLLCLPRGSTTNAFSFQTVSIRILIKFPRRYAVRLRRVGNGGKLHNAFTITYLRSIHPTRVPSGFLLRILDINERARVPLAPFGKEKQEKRPRLRMA